jgi:hypothetical protein
LEVRWELKIGRRAMCFASVFVVPVWYMCVVVSAKLELDVYCDNWGKIFTNVCAVDELYPVACDLRMFV